ncbi:hypothetical protein NQD34_008274 [Periophthalmus magnuspinnatus]|nr:hypothetical protein NQD34_008274 [Periophthalmus magnuspinnatus]
MHASEPCFKDNCEYIQAMEGLCKAIETAFPAKINMLAVTACKQKPDEDTDQFIHRLIETFTVNSGFSDVDPVQKRAFNIHICHAIRRGLIPEVAAAVDKTYVGGLEEPDLDELRKHARHAYLTYQEKLQAKEAKRDKDAFNATMTLFSQARGQRQFFSRRKRRPLEIWV